MRTRIFLDRFLNYWVELISLISMAFGNRRGASGAAGGTASQHSRQLMRVLPLSITLDRFASGETGLGFRAWGFRVGVPLRWRPASGGAVHQGFLRLILIISVIIRVPDAIVRIARVGVVPGLIHSVLKVRFLSNSCLR